MLLQGLMSVRDNCVPVKTHKKTNQPGWYTNALKKQANLYNKTKISKSAYDTNRYNIVRKQNKKLIKQAKNTYLAKSLYKPLQNGDSKAFYKYLRQNRENASNIIPDLDHLNQAAKTPIAKANMLNTFFKSVFIEDDGENVNLTKTPITNEDVDIIVTRAGVLELLMGVNVSKSCGPDNITGILLKTFADCIASSLTDIFNYSLTTGCLPDIWKEANISAVYKKGSRHSPDNYRPISLTCIMCKLLEHIISGHIHTFLDSNNILVDSQHGFRSGRSCETQLVYTFNDLAHNKEMGMITDVIILDFSKAFDSVNHRKLLSKLRCFGIGNQLISWIKDFLRNRGQVVKVENSTSSRCNVISGVPQGSVLGPLLFLLYVNDLSAQLVSECRLFADDAVLYNTRQNKDILQQDLLKLELWSKLWQLSFNTTKCSVLSIKDPSLQQDYYLNNTRIKNVKNHPYLGIELSYDLKWNPHVNKVASKALKLLGMLSRVIKTADTKTRQMAYNTLIRPVLEYGCQVWDPYLSKDIKQLEKIQNRALRFIFRLPPGIISFSELRLQTGIQSLADRRKDLRLNFYFKQIASGVITDTHAQAPLRVHNTRQNDGLYIPSIKTKAFYHSFWPRTIRDIRGNV